MPTVTLKCKAVTDGAMKRMVTPFFGTNNPIEAGAYTTTYYQYGSGMRFPDSPIPKGSKINSAHLRLCAYSAYTGTCNTRIRGQRSGNASPFSTVEDFDARPRTSAYVNWDNIPVWTIDSWYNSVDFASVVQEIVNLDDYKEGNAIGIFWDDFDDRSSHASGLRGADSYYISPTSPPELIIDYTPPAPAPTLAEMLAGIPVYMWAVVAVVIVIVIIAVYLATRRKPR